MGRNDLRPLCLLASSCVHLSGAFLNCSPCWPVRTCRSVRV
jgi:hypothetical protein